MSCPQDSINVYKHVKVCLITHYVSHLHNYLCSFYIPAQNPLLSVRRPDAKQATPVLSLVYNLFYLYRSLFVITCSTDIIIIHRCCQNKHLKLGSLLISSNLDHNIYQRSTKGIQPTQHARQHSSLLVVDNQRRHATYATSDRIQKLCVISGEDPKGTVPGSAAYIL